MALFISIEKTNREQKLLLSSLFILESSQQTMKGAFRDRGVIIPQKILFPFEVIIGSITVQIRVYRYAVIFFEAVCGPDF
ncbi:hypothetical protein HMPREF1013_03016 [Bacillus sp. 2_A_57_CT2]|nr:hypothetical protein HMPREF1013_03016 [Bacillus sp. 2_A_57_CT2]